jgi:hypothetical protein
MWMEEVVAHLFSLMFHSFHPSEADYLVPEQFSLYGVRFFFILFGGVGLNPH